MTDQRGISQDELLAWIEDDLAPGDAADVESRLDLDPELARWARGARADRDAILDLARAEGAAAPRGLWRDALAEAERRALLLDVEVAPIEDRGPFTLRLTPVRLVAAAGFLIVLSLGAISPFLLGPGGGGSGASGPRAAAVAPADSAVGERHRAPVAGNHSLIVEESQSLALGLQGGRRASDQGRVMLASGDRPWAADPNGIVAGRVLVGSPTAGMGYHNMAAMEPSRQPIPGAFPEDWGMSAGEAQRLAADGRLIARVRADDPAAYAERLLHAIGDRGTLLAPEINHDDNGLAAPLKISVRAPIEKTERALRLCAVGARDFHLSAVAPTGRPGAWATDPMWWGASDLDEGEILVLVGRR